MPSDDQAVYATISSVGDIVAARTLGRDLANELGFSVSQTTLIATAISELARNILLYASTGEIILRAAGDSCMVIIARDTGPGIPNVQAAMQPGYSTSGGLGLGLAGVRRIADTFEIQSGPEGTMITITKSKR